MAQRPVSTRGGKKGAGHPPRQPAQSHKQAVHRSREERAARAAAAREAAKRRERQRRLRNVGAVIAVVALVAVGVIIQAVRTSDGDPGVPAGVVRDYGLPAGSTDAPVLVEVYQDYLCPACGRFEREAGPVLEQMIEDERIRVVYYPVAFLDRFSTTRYSTRAVNAVACAADQGAALAMQDLLFEQQPPEGGPGLSNGRLIELGARAGASGSGFQRCVRQEEYRPWTFRATDAASKARVVRTPTVRVDGEELSLPTVDALRAAVRAAERG